MPEESPQTELIEQHRRHVRALAAQIMTQQAQAEAQRPTFIPIHQPGEVPFSAFEGPDCLRPLWDASSTTLQPGRFI